MGIPKLDIDPKLRDSFDRYILLSAKDEDNLRRGNILRPYLKKCGKNLMLAPGATIPWPDKIVIGDDVYIGLWTYIGGGEITLEDRVMMSPHCSMTAGDHMYSPEKEDFSAPITRGPIVIGRGTWLGSGVVVTCGVRVGKANLIAAGAVVTKDTPDYAIMAGVPARQIGSVK